MIHGHTQQQILNGIIMFMATNDTKVALIITIVCCIMISQGLVIKKKNRTIIELNNCSNYSDQANCIFACKFDVNISVYLLNYEVHFRIKSCGLST